MISRNGNDWTVKFPTIVEALRGLPVRSAILDGEVVHLTPEGVSSFSALKTAYLAKMQRKIATNWIALFEELYPERVAKTK